ncbi:MAG TPA: hypothetical protein VGM81_00520 [Burkholderiaceae bacterium]|jgi:MYXO-CTERM domain-containing protein
MKSGHSAFCALALWAASSLVFADPVPLDLTITGKFTVDAVNSWDPTGGATQTAVASALNGGVLSQGSFSGSPSALSQGGALTATGDGVGGLFTMSGTRAGSDATTQGLFADYLFTLANGSATDTYTIFFRAKAVNDASASGSNAFAHSELSVSDALNNEIFFSDELIDTLNPGNNRAAVSASDLFSFVLAPGQSTTFSALQSQLGGAYDDDGNSYSASLDGFLSIDEIRSSATTNGVPSPGTLPLVLTGLVLLALRPRRR